MIGPIKHTIRLIRAGLVLARYDVALPAELTAHLPAPARWLGAAVRRALPAPEVADQSRAGHLSAALEHLGPAWVKLGQFLATRPDILGTELTSDLSALQDQLPPFDETIARKSVAAALGRPIESVFESFGPAIAAASVAQVHRARLKSADDEIGDEVAVKVLRPNIETAFAADLKAFAFAAKMIERFVPSSRRLAPTKIVETLEESVRLELDLRFEAAGASEMAERTAIDPEFCVADVYWPLTSKTVMASQWVEGIPIADHQALIEAGYDLDEIGARLMRCFLTHALRDGLFHADMHPGNLFITRALENGPPVITAVDFGIVGRLDRTMRRFMAETLMGFLTRDYRRIADIHFEVGFVGPNKSVDAFAQALRSVGEPVFGRSSADISMAHLLGQLFEVTRLFDMQLQPQLVMLQKTMVVVEGVARSLSPNINLWETARPVVEDWMTRELGPEARIADAAETALSFARAARRAPEVLEKMEDAALQLSQQTETAHPHAPGQDGGPAPQRVATEARIALWVSAAALVAMALGALN